MGIAVANGVLVAAVAMTLGTTGCGGDLATGDPDLGPIDDTLTYADRVNWPGIDHGASREITFIRGFGNGRPHGYWFLGFAARKTADSFWFCRDSDTACPLDEHQRLNWNTLVGHPLFMRIPGQSGFSPFWQMWTVRVPDDFEADSVKTIETLHRLELEGKVEVSALIQDFGERFGTFVGPQETLLHCALVLRGTYLGDSDVMMPDNSGPVLPLETRFGWHQGYRVDFVDFSPSDGVFPAAEDTETRPLMPFANIYIHWRSCDSVPRPPICDIPGYSQSARRPVSERGLGEDLTGDSDPNDSNNVIGATPCELQRQAENPYSPLWSVNMVRIHANVDVGLIDSYGDQALSDIQSADDIFGRVDMGDFDKPEPQVEDETGNPVPGNEGRLFFNCPAPVVQGYVPFPCATP